MTKHTRNWPSREQWAYRKQHPYCDSETGCPFDDKYSRHLSAYADAEEIEGLRAALKYVHYELGCALKAVNLRLNPSQKQQRGEGRAAWYQRFKQMSPEDREAFNEAKSLQIERSEINDLVN